MRENDSVIVKRCLNGDYNAQRTLYEAHAPKMLPVCLRYAGNLSEAEDMLQEGFIKVFEKLNQYSGKGSLSGWIRAVVVNSSLIYLRKNKKHNFHEDVDQQYDIRSGEFDVLSQMTEQELMNLITNMPDGYRTVFNLFAIEGYGHKEIADMLEISENTSKTQFFKAKAFLRKKIIALEKHVE